MDIVYILKKNKIQGLSSKGDISFASYCLHILYLTKVVGIDFKSAASNL